MQNANPDRRNDESQEQIINEFLMPYYFNKAFKNTKLITDTKMQHVGVDVICDSAFAKKMKIDVKAQSSPKYINQPRPTFSLEVTTFNRYGTEEITGWFFNSKYITEYYTFVWIHRAKVDEKKRIRHADDIELVEVLTVDARALQDYIDNELYNCGLDDIYEVSQDMRYREKERIDVCDGVHYSHSPHLIEKPVNLVVHKKILKRFVIPVPFGHCMITKDNIRTIKPYK